MKFFRAFHFPLILTLAFVMESSRPSLGNSLIWELGNWMLRITMLQRKKCSISLLWTHARTQSIVNVDSPLPHLSPLPRTFQDNPEATRAVLGTLWALGGVARLWSQTSLHVNPALHFIVMWPWACHLIILSLSFLICKIGTIISVLQDVWLSMKITNINPLTISFVKGQNVSVFFHPCGKTYFVWHIISAQKYLLNELVYKILYRTFMNFLPSTRTPFMW